MNKQNINYMQDKKLCWLKISSMQSCPYLTPDLIHARMFFVQCFRLIVFQILLKAYSDRSNQPQVKSTPVKSAPSQIGPRSNRIVLKDLVLNMDMIACLSNRSTVWPFSYDQCKKYWHIVYALTPLNCYKLTLKITKRVHSNPSRKW
jgi:hypothetical protein